MCAVASLNTRRNRVFRIARVLRVHMPVREMQVPRCAFAAAILRYFSPGLYVAHVSQCGNRGEGIPEHVIMRGINLVRKQQIARRALACNSIVNLERSRIRDSRDCGVALRPLLVISAMDEWR